MIPYQRDEPELTTMTSPPTTLTLRQMTLRTRVPDKTVRKALSGAPDRWQLVDSERRR